MIRDPLVLDDPLIAGAPTAHRRTAALYLLCLGVLMTVLDTTIVGVALPSVLTDLHLSGAQATWLVNAYTLAFGGFLLLGGRLGDLYGRRRLFMAGIAAFTAASAVCGLTHTFATLLAARTAQGLGGAIVAAVSLSLIAAHFPEPTERAKAMGIYGFVCAAGGGVGEVLGGVLSDSLNWHWIFLINLPIGTLVYISSWPLLPPDPPPPETRRPDLAGAVTITTALTLLVYTLIRADDLGWNSVQTQVSLGIVLSLLLLFAGIEQRVPDPLVPLKLFRRRNFSLANILGAAWAAAALAWFVIAALYLQRVLGYQPFQVGLSFLPSELIIAAFSIGAAARMVARFGTRGPLCLGLLLAAAGLAAFAHAPLHGTFATAVLPGMLLLGLGAGMAATPLLLIAMNEVPIADSGLASGVTNTSFTLGGAIGLAWLASLADSQTRTLQKTGVEAVAALNGGYHLAFLIAAATAATSAIVGFFTLRPAASLKESSSPMSPNASHSE